PGRFACLSIADSGTGIPKEAVDHIFEPFFTTKDPGKGTGLGLAAIYGIIQEHKGWIHVYSEPGKGSTFKIYLPVHETSPAKKPSSAGAKSLRETGAGERILIVEDDPSVRALAENALSTAGYQVDCVSTAEDAVKRFNASDHSFSLLISDVILPKKNGAELAAELLRKNPELPVILCSGYSGDRIQQTGIHPDDFFFLEKPFEIADLLDLVHTLMKGSR
ncbi:MAG TPA: response regulator, partial [Tichowtungia sp.]|nr:response regulator [Tichowtungia sp.]